MFSNIPSQTRTMEKAMRHLYTQKCNKALGPYVSRKAVPTNLPVHKDVNSFLHA
jgi:hypothetical protein